MMKLRLGEEMSKKYMHGCVLLRESAGAKPFVAFIDGYQNAEEDNWPPKERATRVMALSIEEETRKRQFKPINLTEYIIDFSIPELGYINDDETGICTYTSKSHKKQWKRNLTDNTINISPHFAGHSPNEIKGTKVDKVGGGFRFYNKIYCNKLYPFERAIDLILRGEYLSLAFTRDYALGLDALYKDNIAVYYKNVLIGIVDKKDDAYVIVLPTEAAHFIEDLSQYAQVIIK